MARFDIRVSDELAEQVRRAASERGFEGAVAFVCQAIANELRYGESALGEVEERIAASLGRLAREVRRVGTA